MLKLNKFTIQKSFAISAGAGSGKTYTLSRRYINALLDFDYFKECYEVDKVKYCNEAQESFLEDLKPAKVNQIVTITYTEAAALEMKSRIFELINKIINYDNFWIIEQTKRQNKKYKKDIDFESIDSANKYSPVPLDYIKETLKQAYTDSSNSKISTIHAYCLDIIKSNSDIARMDTKLSIIKDDEKQKELTSIIFEVLNNQENKELVLDISQDISIFFINNLINKYVSNTKFRKDYDSFHGDSINEDTYKKLIEELYPLPNIDEALIELKDDAVRLKWFQEFYDNFKNFKASTWKDVNKDVKSPSMGEKKFPSSDLLKKELESGSLISIYSQIDTNKENLFFDKIDKIKDLLNQIKNKYDSKLNELNKIDFDTIITKTLEIIPQVKTNFKYIMVDEFQDTNAIQFEIIKNSCNADTNLFVVGDSKQSIYSFQGAEIEVFNDAIHDTNIFSSIEPMDKNHRSDGVVLNTVNKIFKKVLKKDENLKLIKPNYEADAQELKVFKEERVKEGSFKYLITPQKYQKNEPKVQIEESANELDTITQFVSEIYYSKNKDYKHISELIAKKEQAIAIIFDSSTKMLELKQKLRDKGITAKISTSDNFYYTKEVNDIFNVLKAIDILSKEPNELSQSEKYYVVGAMRSNILRCDDNSIKMYLDANKVSDNLTHYVELFKAKTLSQVVKYIYDDSNIMGVYAHYDDIEQRISNLYKFLALCKDYEESSESNLYNFLALIENAIYFSEAKEPEAFFKSDNTKSVEICSIHSTKGLAYPLVLLANSDKGLYSQITSDSLKHNNFTLNNEKKEIVGFKINGYEPLSLRVLKQIDKLKHLAEKKRLLYVALTRAKHDVVISACLKQTANGEIPLREDSYLHMICAALNIEKDELYNQNENYCIKLENNSCKESIKEQVKYINHELKTLTFISKEKISATSSNENKNSNEIAIKLGMITHKIFELYWDKFEKIDIEFIFNKFGIFEENEQLKIKNSIEKFMNSHVYKLLKNGVEHRFELEFNYQDKTGFIDLIYFIKDKECVIIDFKTGIKSQEKEEVYQKQLKFYEEVLSDIGMSVVGKEILWV